jgi:hypothetical protein
MNEERTAIINLALAGRLPAADAGALLDALWPIELGEAFAVEPPCRRPPWMEGVADLNDLVGEANWTALLPAATRQIERALVDSDRRLLTMAISALDVISLGEFPSRPDWTGYMLGGFAVSPGGGSLERSAVSIWNFRWWERQQEPSLWDRPIALWLFSEPLDLALAAAGERETIVTPYRTFPDCLKLEYWVDRAPGGFVHGWGARSAKRHDGGSTIWLAPGLGPVRVVCDDAEEPTTTIDLIDSGPAGGDSPFPLAAGNWWRFERAGPGPVHRELWRTLAPQPDGSVWLSAAASFSRGG